MEENRRDPPGAVRGGQDLPRLDAIVGRLVERRLGLDDLVEGLRADPGIEEVRVLGGLVKTEPPVVELAVRPAGDPGASSPASERVYDLVQQTDGTVTLARSHPGGPPR